MLFSILGYTFPFYPSNSLKNENFKKRKNLVISSFYTSVPKIMIIGFTVSEIWYVMDVIVTFHFGLFFALLPPNSPKNENFKKRKIYLQISSFYISVPKIMIICITVPKIWHVTHVIVIFHFELFFALLPPSPNSPKNKKLKKFKKIQDIIILHRYTKNYDSMMYGS